MVVVSSAALASVDFAVPGVVSPAHGVPVLSFSLVTVVHTVDAAFFKC